MSLRGKMLWAPFESTAGENSRTGKLTNEDVIAIRSTVFPAAGEARKKALNKTARKYGISVSHLRAIIRGKRWRHLDKECDQ